MNPRGSSRWLRLGGYLLMLIAAQSLLTRLFSFVDWPAPDLFLLTGAGLALRLGATRAVLAAYGIGLLQDLLGAGALGFHAAGVAGGALLVLFVRKSFGEAGGVQSLLTVLAAVAGQWGTFLILNYGLRKGLITMPFLLTTVPAVLLSTWVCSYLWERVMVWGLGARGDSEQRYA